MVMRLLDGTRSRRCKVPTVKSQLEENQKVMQVLRDNLTLAQNRMKQQADQHRT